jgi:hypothetical protein
VQNNLGFYRGWATSGGHDSHIIIEPAVMGVPLQAQEKPAVQELTGPLELNDPAFYVLRHLKHGQSLSLEAEGTSGDFDPVLALLKPEVDFARALQLGKDEIDKASAEGRDPVAVIDEAVQKYILARNDDTGEGYTAAITFKVPVDGDYQLVLASTAARPTFGSYRLLVGINAPQVLTGKAQPTGAVIASLVEMAKRLWSSGLTSTLLSSIPWLISARSWP